MCGLKPLFWRLVVQVNRQPWLVCKRSCKANATKFLWVRLTQQMLSRTLPSTKAGLDMFGIYEGIDYVVGKWEVTWFYSCLSVS
jgi:hypothetical protein